MVIKIGGKRYRTTAKFKKVVIAASAAMVIASTLPFIPKQVTYAQAVEEVDITQQQEPLTTRILSDLNERYNQLIAFQQRLEQAAMERAQIEAEKKKPKFQVLSWQQISSMDLRKPSGLTEEQIESIVKGTPLEGTGGAFVKGEELYGVNALYAVSHAALESKWGRSKIARTKNNIFGFTAYDNNPGQSAKAFKTKDDCILFVMRYISENYLNENGQHHNGFTLKAMNVKYASDNRWAGKIADVMVYAQKKVVKAKEFL